MRFEIHGKMKSLIAVTLCSLALGLWACSDEVETPVAAPNLSELFENIDDADIDLESHAIVLPEGTDSFTVDNIAALGGKKCYLALDDDPVDPEIDWDNPVSTGTTLAIEYDGDVDGAGVRVLAQLDGETLSRIRLNGKRAAQSSNGYLHRRGFVFVVK